MPRRRLKRLQGRKLGWLVATGCFLIAVPVAATTASARISSTTPIDGLHVGDSGGAAASALGVNKQIETFAVTQFGLQVLAFGQQHPTETQRYYGSSAFTMSVATGALSATGTAISYDVGVTYAYDKGKGVRGKYAAVDWHDVTDVAIAEAEYVIHRPFVDLDLHEDHTGTWQVDGAYGQPSGEPVVLITASTGRDYGHHLTEPQVETL